MRASRRLSAEQILRNISLAADFLSHRPGVKRVWLFGSAAKGKQLDWRSDLDFAVEGLPEDQLERTWSELYSRLDLPLDLVRWEGASGTLRQEVRCWGKLLYEA